MAPGAFPDTHPLGLGMPGMHGIYTAVTALQEADLLVALGARFDDRVTGKLADFAPNAKVIHVDIDPAEIGKNRAVRRADRRRRQGRLADAGRASLPRRWGAAARPHRAWLAARWTTGSSSSRCATPRRRRPAQAAARGRAAVGATGGDAIVVAGVGQHQMHAAQHYWFTKPRSWINSGGAGHHGLRGAGRDGRPDRAGPASWWSRSTATAASR